VSFKQTVKSAGRAKPVYSFRLRESEKIIKKGSARERERNVVDAHAKTTTQNSFVATTDNAQKKTIDSKKINSR